VLIARWLFLLAGLAACASVALYLITRNPLYWRLAQRIFTGAIALAVLFFAGLLFERLVLL
jgi:predicted membrane-bound dolichyl-phosphate-mannose-protein mannosyltransferase